MKMMKSLISAQRRVFSPWVGHRLLIFRSRPRPSST